VAERVATACTTRRSTGERWVRVLLGVAILGVIPLAALELVRGLARLGADTWPGALAGLLLGLLAVDAITGVLHWACDTWGSPRTPWIGAGLIRAFREHHRDPGAICRHDWLEVNREPALAAGLGFVILGLAPAPLVGHPAAHAFAWTLFSFGALANQVHRWAHQARAPRPVRWLQRCGVVLSPARHARHHRPPHARAYCIATGWLNAPLDALGVWRGLERGIRAALRSRRRARRRQALRASP
jgi:plasmanylethanolamine desaturase